MCLCVCVAVASGFHLFHSSRHQTQGQNAWRLVSMETGTVGSEPSKRLLFYRPCLPRPHASTLRLFLICACLLRSIKCCISLPPDSRRLFTRLPAVGGDAAPAADEPRPLNSVLMTCRAHFSGKHTITHRPS